MRAANRTYRTVVLLGAGATRGASTGIGRAKIRPPLNRDFLHVARKFGASAAGRRHKAAITRLDRFIDQEMGRRGADLPTMEDIFNVLFMSKDMPEVFFKRGRKRASGYRVEIKDFIGLVVGLLRYIQANPRHPQGLNHHARLALSLDPQDTVISLNYDTLVDNALFVAGWDPKQGYGFDLDAKKLHVSIKPHTNSLEGVRLLKPHGSLNWFAQGKVERLEEALLHKRKPSVELSNVPRSNLNRGQVRLFIPPLYVKFFSNPFWQRIWNEAFESLVNAQQLVIIGCSLIETDFHLRSVVAAAVARRHQKFKRIVLVEPSQAAITRLKRFLRGRGDGIVVYQTFTTFVRQAL